MKENQNEHSNNGLNIQYLNLGNGKIIEIHTDELIYSDEISKFFNAYSKDNSEKYVVKMLEMQYEIQNKILLNHLYQIYYYVQDKLNKEILIYNDKLQISSNICFVYNCFPHFQLGKLLERNEINFNQNSIVNFALNLGKMIQSLHEKNFIFANLCPLHIYFSDKETFSDIKLDISPFSMIRGSNFHLDNYKGFLYYQFPELYNSNQIEITNFIDIYSYGSLLYECLFRKKYNYESVLDNYSKHKKLKNILDLIFSCTKQNPKERKSMSEILNLNIFKACTNFFELKERDVENDFNLTLIKEENDNSNYYLRYKATEKKTKKANKFYEVIRINPNKFDKNALKNLLQKERKISESISKSDFGPRYEGFYEFKNEIYLIKHYLNDNISLEEYIERKININEKCILTGFEGILLQEWLNHTLYQLFIESKVKCAINPRNIFLLFDESKRIFGIKLYDYGFLETLFKAALEPIKSEKLISNYYFPLIPVITEEKYYLFISGLITYFIIYGTHFLKEPDNKALLSQKKFKIPFPKLDQELEVFKSITIMCLNPKSDLTFSYMFNQLRKNNNYIKILNEIPEKYTIGSDPEQSMGFNIYITKDQNYVVKKYYIKKVSDEDEDMRGKMTEIKALNLIIALNSFKKKCKYITQIVDSFQINNVLHVVESKYGDCTLDSYYKYFNTTGGTEEEKIANMKVVGKCIGKAIQFLTSLSYIHRNVCPSNIIVRISKEKIIEASLCGFSSCKHLSLKYQMKVPEALKSNQIEKESMIQEDFYQCPDFQDIKKINLTYDIWGLVMSLIFMYCGHNPVPGELLDLNELVLMHNSQSSGMKVLSGKKYINPDFKNLIEVYLN